MDVFQIHEDVIADYRAFTCGFVAVRDERIQSRAVRGPRPSRARPQPVPAWSLPCLAPRRAPLRSPAAVGGPSPSRLEQLQAVLGASRRPQGTEVVVLIGQRPATTSRYETRIPYLREDQGRPPRSHPGRVATSVGARQERAVSGT